MIKKNSKKIIIKKLLTKKKFWTKKNAILICNINKNYKM